MGIQSRRDIVYLALAGFFVTNAILGELTGGKLFALGPFTLSIGVSPWPVVFIATDLINEYFGREGVRRLTFMTIGLKVFTPLLSCFSLWKFPPSLFRRSPTRNSGACSAIRYGTSSVASSPSP